MVWNELAVALCMVLVIEGILPFLSPRRWRSVAEMAGRVDDLTVRMLGPVEHGDWNDVALFRSIV